jgi:hypothetical protein
MQPAQASTVPGLEQLERMPEIINAIVAGASDEALRWKPSPTRWSVLEVLGHLAHVEVHGFRGRTERILAEENPLLENYDPDALIAAGAYDQPDVATALASYRRERARSVELLRSIRPEQLSRSAVHGVLGPVTLRNLLHEWPYHDVGHMRQVAELVRTARFYPHIGGWQQFYDPKP